MNECMNGWINECMNAWMDEWMNEWMNEWIRGADTVSFCWFEVSLQRSLQAWFQNQITEGASKISEAALEM